MIDVAVIVVLDVMLTVASCNFVTYWIWVTVLGPRVVSPIMQRPIIASANIMR